VNTIWTLRHGRAQQAFEKAVKADTHIAGIRYRCCTSQHPTLTVVHSAKDPTSHGPATRIQAAFLPSARDVRHPCPSWGRLTGRTRVWKSLDQVTLPQHSSCHFLFYCGVHDLLETRSRNVQAERSVSHHDHNPMDDEGAESATQSSCQQSISPEQPVSSVPFMKSRQVLAPLSSVKRKMIPSKNHGLIKERGPAPPHAHGPSEWGVVRDRTASCIDFRGSSIGRPCKPPDFETAFGVVVNKAFLTTDAGGKW
jgi:hypothetical protein